MQNFQTKVVNLFIFEVPGGKFRIGNMAYWCLKIENWTPSTRTFFSWKYLGKIKNYKVFKVLPNELFWPSPEITGPQWQTKNKRIIGKTKRNIRKIKYKIK